MLFTEVATQQFTDASLKIYRAARCCYLEPWPGAPIFISHRDIALALDSGTILDSGRPIEWISKACVAWAVNVLMFLYGEMDDELGATGRHIREDPIIIDFKRLMDTQRATHIAVSIVSSLDSRHTYLRLRFLIFDMPRLPSSASAA